MKEVKNKKLSIIIPAYNVENHIKKTLMSLIDQTVQTFEIVIVVDGATDGTYNAAKTVLNENGFEAYKLIELQRNSGVSVARNKGLEIASGEYVLFLDGDDYLHEKVVKRMLDAVNGEQCIDSVFWAYSIVTEDGTVIQKYFDKHLKDVCCLTMTGAKALRRIVIDETMRVCTGSIAFRRQMLIDYELKYTPGCSNGEDQEFSIKALSMVNRLVFINETGTYYLQRKGSITNRYDISKFEAVEAMERTSQQLGSAGDSSIVPIAKAVKNKTIIQNYLYNLRISLVHSHIKIKNLISEIDQTFPGMNTKVRSAMQEYDGINKKLGLKIRLFLFSPSLFSLVIRLQAKITAKDVV